MLSVGARHILHTSACLGSADMVFDGRDENEARPRHFSSPHWSHVPVALRGKARCEYFFAAQYNFIMPIRLARNRYRIVFAKVLISHAPL